MNRIKSKMLEKADRRIWEIDFLRGILIIGMVIDHLMFFIGMFGGMYPQGALPSGFISFSNFANAYWLNEGKIVVRFLGVALFFTLTGVSSRFSKSNLKRSLICMGFGVLLALAYMTYSLISRNSFYVLFGVITCLGFGMFAYWGLRALYIKIFKDDKNWKWWSLGIGLVLMFTGFIVNMCLSSSLRFGHIILSMFGQFNPGQFNSLEPLTFGKAILSILGFYVWGNDVCGIMPFVGFTFLGGFLGEHLYSKKISLFFRKDPEKNRNFNTTAIRKTWVINWLGSKTFIIYLLHPVVIVIILFAIYSIAARSLPVL